MARAFKSRWWIVVGAILGIISSYGPLVVFSFGVLLKPIAAEFHWDRRTVSAALTVSLLVSAVVTPYVGRLVDRHGIRSVTLPGIILFALALAAVGLTPPSPLVFVLLYAIVGITGAVQAPLPYVKSVSAWFDDRRGLALGLSIAGVGIGAAFVPPFAQALVGHFGWRIAYLGLGVLTMVLAVPAVSLFIREQPHAAGAEGAAAPPMVGHTLREALSSSPRFWVMAVSFTLASIAMGGMTVHMVPLLTDHGLAPSVAASTAAAGGVALMVGRIAAGYALDRIFAPFLAAFFFLCPLVGLGVLVSGWHGVWPFVGAGLVGLGLGAEVDLIAFLATRYFGLRAFGEIYGYLFAAFSIGAAIGPFAMATSYDALGSYTVALAGCGACLLAAALLILTLGRYAYPPAAPVRAAKLEPRLAAE